MVFCEIVCFQVRLNPSELDKWRANQITKPLQSTLALRQCLVHILAWKVKPKKLKKTAAVESVGGRPEP